MSLSNGVDLRHLMRSSYGTYLFLSSKRCICQYRPYNHLLDHSRRPSSFPCDILASRFDLNSRPIFAISKITYITGHTASRIEHVNNTQSWNQNRSLSGTNSYSSPMICHHLLEPSALLLRHTQKDGTGVEKAQRRGIAWERHRGKGDKRGQPASATHTDCLGHGSRVVHGSPLGQERLPRLLMHPRPLEGSKGIASPHCVCKLPLTLSSLSPSSPRLFLLLSLLQVHLPCRTFTFLA